MKLVSIAANPVPENVVAGSLTTPDGVTLRYARWLPPAGRKGTVCLFQGRGEFIEKYYETVTDLRARGFAVAALDWRGQGLSDRALRDRNKGHIENFSQYETDLETFMHEVVLPDCPPPLFAIGHSMGCAVLLRAAQRGHRWFDRMVLSAPMIALHGVRSLSATKAILRGMRLCGFGGSYIPTADMRLVGTQPFVDNVLTSDPVRYARNAAILEAEPALGLAAPTVAWADAAFRVMSDFSQGAYPATIRQPILAVAAGRDRVVSTPAIEDFAIRLRTGSHLVIAGAQHEILMDQDRHRTQFWAAFDAFVPGTPLY
jgi:lysophospholipase